MHPVPVIIFAYNRPQHFKKTIEHLVRNALAVHTDLYIFVDGPKHDKDRKMVKQVQKLAQEVTGFASCHVDCADKNKGLANSVIDGVTQIIKQYGRVIVLEDDILVAEDFLDYMNASLDIYQDRQDVFSITGYGYSVTDLPALKEYAEDVYLSYRCNSWGWATWQACWEQVDWGGYYPLRRVRQKLCRGGEDLLGMLASFYIKRIDSWAVRWALAHALRDALCLHPVKSLVNNIGFDGSGVHCQATTHTSEKLYPVKRVFPKELALDAALSVQFAGMFALPIRDKIKYCLKCFMLHAGLWRFIRKY